MGGKTWRRVAIKIRKSINPPLEPALNEVKGGRGAKTLRRKKSRGKKGRWL
jgi:hypothetical protein